MKLDEWGKLLISWANFLDPNENIGKIEDLSTSGLFSRLLNVLQSNAEIENNEEYYLYLKEQYSSLDFSGQKNREVAVLQATAFLIYCSLHHPNNDLQQKMIDLPHLIQCQLTDFLQEFVDVPKSKITRELIFSKISEMRNFSGLESSSVRTPPNFGTPVTYTSSPSTEEIMASKTNSSTKKTSRIKKLRRDIDMLSTLKAELTEELDSAKECISKLETDIKKKDTEISRLNLELKKIDKVDHICEKQKTNENFKIEKLKNTVQNLEQQKCELEDNLISLKNEKEQIYEELKKTKSIIQKAEVQRKLSDDFRASLEEEIENLKLAIEQLTVTNEEQSEFIAELTRAKDDSKCFSDSQSESVILPESLGQHVVDLQVRELKEELDNKETEISELKTNIDGLNSIIAEKIKSIEEYVQLSKSQGIELQEKTSHIRSLKESLSDLNNDLQISHDSYQKIMVESELKINELQDELRGSHQAILDLKTEKETLETVITSKIEKIKVYEDEITNLKYAAQCRVEEISSLKDYIQDLQTKLDNTLKTKKEHIDAKNKQIKALEDTVTSWVNRNVELNNLLTNLTEEIEEKNVTIKNNQTDLRNLECQNLFLTNTLQEKDSIINSMQTSINSMSEEITSLKHKESSLVNELKGLNCHILQLQTKASDLNELLNICVSEKNLLLKTVEDKEITIQQQITKLKDMKTDFEARKRKLESDLEQKEKEYKEAEEDRCRLNIDLDDLKHKFLSLEVKIKEKEKEILDNYSMIEKLKADIERQIQKEKDLNHCIKDYEQNIIKAEQELESSKTAVSELQKVVSQLLSEAEEHNKEEFNLKNQIFTNVEIINNLKIKLYEAEKKEKDITEENLKEKESLNSIIEELKSSLVKVNDDLAVNYKISDLLTKDLTERNETIKTLENNNKNLKSELLSLKEKNHLLINDTISRDVVIEELKSKLESCKNEIDSLVIEKSDISRALEFSKKDFDSEIIKSECLQIKLSDALSKVNIMTAELSSSDNLILNLKKEVDELKLLKLSIEDSRESALHEIESLKDSIHQLEIRKMGTEKELKESESQMLSMKLQIDELHKQINLVENSNLNLKKELELIESKCNCLEKERENLKEQVMKEKTISEQLKEECKNKTGQVNDYSQKLEDILTKSHSEIKKLEENYSTEKSKLTREYNSLLANIENLKDEKEKLNVVVKNLEENHYDCENKISKAECLSMELKDKIINLSHEVSKYKEKEAVSKNELEDKNSIIKNLNNEIDCLKKLISTYEFEEGILNTKLQTKDAEINKLELNILDLNKHLRNSEEKFEEELESKLKKINDLDCTIGKLNTQYVQVSNEKESLIVEIENKKTLELDLKSLETKYQLLKGEKVALEQEAILKSEEISQLQLNIYSIERELKSLKTENQNQSKMLDLKMKELEDTKSNMKALQNETLEAKMNEKILMDQLILYNDMIVATEQNIALSETELQEAESELFLLKDSIQKKDEVIDSLMKEKNCLKLDMDILSKKNEMMISQLESKKNDNQELCNKLNQAENEISKLTLKKTEQDQTIDSLYNTLHSQNIEINEKNNEIDLLQKEVKSVIQQLNDERSNNFNEIQQKLKVEKEDAKVVADADLKDHIDQVKSSYEKKVHVLKSVMKKQFTEKLEDLTYSLQNENTDLKEKLLKEQERCARLQSELWNASDKLLIAQEQNRTLLSNLQNRNAYEVVRPSEPLSPLSKARSLEVLSGRNRGIDNFARDISLNESGSSRRSSIRSLPRGMGKKFSFSAGRVFPAAEEDGEVFDNRYLADLKAGRCDIQYEPDRMSILQYRNSLCPPHLKSSYPAETQFISSVKEDDIKAGASSSACNENDVRKTKVQGNEKSCSSTPRSGQSSYTLPREQSHERFILREANIKREMLAKPIKPSTPSRLKALFTHKKDENSPRRKSFFRRT